MKIINGPDKKAKSDKKINLLVENKLMSRLTLQVLNDYNEILGVMSLTAGESQSLSFKNNNAKYFIRPLMPSSSDISLAFIGGQIEVP